MVESRENVMGKSSKYEAKVPDENGIIPYTEEEHSVWHDLYKRQMDVIQNRVCDEFLQGLEILGLPSERIPQPTEVSKVLMERTGWQV
ncbi:MAG: phenylalanine 4-monooxygenase, partial [Wenzhouxiangella sp.]|nr:phenylalanine 4-monooxygenase [Wenzhouxiangella sp.]